MDTIDELNDFIQNGYKVYFPNITIDCVIFGYENRQLKVLILKTNAKNDWSLPGGFIKRTESLTGAATRILKERTSLDNVFLKQFHNFGDSAFRMNDDRVITIDETNKLPIVEISKDCWLLERTFSVGYYALIDCSKAIIKSDLYFDDYKWVNIEELPNNLSYDHNEIFDVALKTIRNQIFHEPIGYELLPEKFTLPEIQTLYETILDKKLHRRNFPNKLLTMKIIEKLEEKRNIGQHRSPFLYKFHKTNYTNALNERLALTL
ncbi:MAG TPA: NUDIX domain-containing protein [Flavobacterium sp.]|uniref:NUDIX hydrolase n=1 Tax=Flavobacterium TaxID=237 RepID=UPI002ED4FC4F